MHAGESDGEIVAFLVSRYGSDILLKPEGSGVASLVWIWLAWPGGATFITFAVIGITLFAPWEDEAYAAARRFTVGTSLTAVLAAAVAFAVLPQLSMASQVRV